VDRGGCVRRTGNIARQPSTRVVCAEQGFGQGCCPIRTRAPGHQNPGDTGTGIIQRNRTGGNHNQDNVRGRLIKGAQEFFLGNREFSTGSRDQGKIVCAQAQYRQINLPGGRNRSRNQGIGGTGVFHRVTSFEMSDLNPLLHLGPNEFQQGRSGGTGPSGQRPIGHGAHDSNGLFELFMNRNDLVVVAQHNYRLPGQAGTHGSRIHPLISRRHRGSTHQVPFQQAVIIRQHERN